MLFLQSFIEEDTFSYEKFGIQGIVFFDINYRPKIKEIISGKKNIFFRNEYTPVCIFLQYRGVFVF